MAEHERVAVPSAPLFYQPYQSHVPPHPLPMPMTIPASTGFTPSFTPYHQPLQPVYYQDQLVEVHPQPQLTSYQPPAPPDLYRPQPEPLTPGDWNSVPTHGLRTRPRPRYSEYDDTSPSDAPIHAPAGKGKPKSKKKKKSGKKFTKNSRNRSVTASLMPPDFIGDATRLYLPTPQGHLEIKNATGPLLPIPVGVTLDVHNLLIILPANPNLIADGRNHNQQEIDSSKHEQYTCRVCSKTYAGPNARSVARRHLQDKHGIPLAVQQRRTRWDCPTSSKPTLETSERRERNLQSKRTYAQRSRVQGRLEKDHQTYLESFGPRGLRTSSGVILIAPRFRTVAAIDASPSHGWIDGHAEGLVLPSDLRAGIAALRQLTRSATTGGAEGMEEVLEEDGDKDEDLYEGEGEVVLGLDIKPSLLPPLPVGGSSNPTPELTSVRVPVPVFVPYQWSSSASSSSLPSRPGSGSASRPASAISAQPTTITVPSESGSDTPSSLDEVAEPTIQHGRSRSNTQQWSVPYSVWENGTRFEPQPELAAPLVGMHTQLAHTQSTGFVQSSLETSFEYTPDSEVAEAAEELINLSTSPSKEDETYVYPHAPSLATPWPSSSTLTEPTIATPTPIRSSVSNPLRIRSSLGTAAHPFNPFRPEAPYRSLSAAYDDPFVSPLPQPKLPPVSIKRNSSGERGNQVRKAGFESSPSRQPLNPIRPNAAGKRHQLAKGDARAGSDEVETWNTASAAAALGIGTAPGLGVASTAASEAVTPRRADRDKIATPGSAFCRQYLLSSPAVEVGPASRSVSVARTGQSLMAITFSQ